MSGAFDDKIDIQPLPSSFIICKCGCKGMDSEFTASGMVRKYIHGHNNLTEEQRKQTSERMSKVLLNHPDWLTPDIRHKAHESVRERYKTDPSYIENQSKARKGKKFTIEHKQHQSESFKLAFERGERKGWHGTIDISSIRCSLCGSDKTYILKRNGRPDWRYINKQRVCTYCYKKRWYAEHGKQWYQERGKLNQILCSKRWQKERGRIKHIFQTTI